MDMMKKKKHGLNFHEVDDKVLNVFPLLFDIVYTFKHCLIIKVLLLRGSLCILEIWVKVFLLNHTHIISSFCTYYIASDKF